jgi:predicted transcriptional regulator of viral defense system
LKITATSAILERLAQEHRRVLSDWRALILLRRSTFALPPVERRWANLPHHPDDLSPLLQQMRRRGELKTIKGFHRIYEVTVPYARIGFVDEREVLFELNPYAVLSHFTALMFHALTEELPKGMMATISADRTGGLIPLGTEPHDWEGLQRPGARTPSKVLGHPVTWKRVQPQWFFGFAVYQPHGYPIRVTTPERTLLDALQSPRSCGGTENVLRAWAIARDTVDLDAMVYHVERFDIAVLRQRVGYILDELGLSHPLVDSWRTKTHRGGSSRLIGAAPFSPHFDARWNLSLNAPVAVLHQDSA